MHGFELIYHIPDEFPRIQCNRKDLLEIFYCLAENAIQAMEGRGKPACANAPAPARRAGGGKLVIRANLVLRPGEDPLGNIVIADTGPGLPEETLNHLFEPFMTTKELDKGNGLGLCLVKSLVRKNRGSVSVSSFRGCGTTFTLAFGVAKAGGHEQAKNLALAS